ncbi:ribose-5-phosphate isomerase RpiA [Companilactobacillus halodurans]|uniref:Ribose-5-phosphate isomerase A n=1 Tax=Companilactobacillus halodurans TaxID=2584183 RepID=A0A5P0ZND7_9LACO|nr:ribose-5-phosphate isomerase RpiA [Companilactobacillus halodurans]MQS75734.1 ribose-5-phosphate isomerase RpiA [Companilactobacillus halodurans]MQS98044.1 ribose-5-phosphate isomerase RpiA [Companilactobacillus halodurans]
MNQNELKKAVGVKSVDYFKSDSVVGLGTGSTVYYMIEELGRRYQAGDIKNIVAVTTSSRSEKQAKSLGIPTKDLNEVDHIDVTIDGADQIDKNYQGIKGGGAAHLLEKMVATNSTKNIWIVDQSKMADQLGSFPLPLEVIPFGCEKTFEDLKKENLKPEFRLDENGKRVLTHNKNYVIDLKMGTINHPHLLADWLDHQVGIVAHGLFLDIVNTIIVGYEDGPKVIDNIR